MHIILLFKFTLHMTYSANIIYTIRYEFIYNMYERKFYFSIVHASLKTFSHNFIYFYEELEHLIMVRYEPEHIVF
jgi:hypothetical protein